MGTWEGWSEGFEDSVGTWEGWIDGSMDSDGRLLGMSVGEILSVGLTEIDGLTEGPMDGTSVQYCESHAHVPSSGQPMLHG